MRIVQASRSHSDTPHSEGQPWMSDQPDARPLPDSTQHSQERDNCAPGGIRPAIPAGERPPTNALDRAATGISYLDYSRENS